MIEQLAVLVYGVLTIVGALVLSSQVGSPLATALALAAAAMTYLFQVGHLYGVRESALLAVWVLVTGALLASVAVSLWSAI
jgi:hypothetical protein